MMNIKITGKDFNYIYDANVRSYENCYVMITEYRID